jgi:glycine/D-amino acid oxidase-like deaminating enzyme
VFATNSPVNDRVAIHTKQSPYRTYAIAARVPKGSVPDALVWDTYDAYHYVRIQPLQGGEDLIIVGGEDHRSGEASDFAKRLADLERWPRKRYPSLGKVVAGPALRRCPKDTFQAQWRPTNLEIRSYPVDIGLQAMVKRVAPPHL